MKVHVFLGEFNSRKEATSYTESYWEPEPDETASDEEYALWENNNPKWKMESDLKCYLDGDFIETITDENKFEYLCGMIENSEDIKHLKTELKGKELILIFEKAINSENAELKSTDRIEYKGVYESTLK
ncbi:hypothetical protein KLA_17294 [Cellulophaga geojensis KL-A]|uniref:Uncharacterized protein n=1 Tax=Cellulophaga geojensis KL-A TaxID=1328323 RepID=A0ABN0RJE9_9FLAO|nr:hypothetical protein [Cellulophaga geojensis]EWH09373.1 hypothetical protein KLA_17294 [Cellulophaga geojensis KL-A]